jgi:predicted nuclease of predicted toxin-antitoxin system
VTREPRFLADEDFNRDIVAGVLRRVPTADMLRVHDAGLAGAQDPDILAWAAAEARIVLTHDTRTMIAYARARVTAAQRMPGLIVVRQELPIRVAFEELVVIAVCSEAPEWEHQIRFIPL